MLWFDSETYSETPIKWGTYRYTSTCELMVATYALNDEPVQCWDRTSNPKIPEYLDYLLRDTDEPITAHAAMFDRNALKYGLGIDIPIERWRCSMVRALAHALPGGLDLLCEILDVPQDLRKIKDGKRLIRLFCMPRPKNSVLRRATRLTHPKEWADFLLYAINDPEAVRALDKKIPRWNSEGEELALWHLDQKINDRGIYVDVPFAQAAVRAVEQEKLVLKKRTSVLTSGTVESTTQRDQLLGHILHEYGVELPDMQMSTIERRVNDLSLPPELRELLAIRLQASSTSTSKYQALLNGVMPDGRLRGTLQFNGAGRTRRHAGRTFQPQNLPSKGLPPTEEIDAGIEAIIGGYADLVCRDVMAAASHGVRGCVIAPPGKKLVIADLANIEGRVAAWLAGEEWKLQAFRDYDTFILDVGGNRIRTKDGKDWERKGPDLYKLAYANSFKVAIETVTKDHRQVGKVEELMLQYQGRIGAWVTGAATYGIDLEALADTVYDTLPGDVIHDSTRFLAWYHKENMPTFGLSDKAFITCDGLTMLWRRSQSAISSLWPELEAISIQAVENPGNTFECRRFKIRRDGGWLRIRLPSGRYLCYPSPQVKDRKLSYLGINQYTRKWCRIGTYGGKLFENACQALAGDIMKSAMPRIEDAGYEIIFTVHDEVPTEAPDSEEFNAKHLSSLLSTVPPWAEGLPLAAAGFETKRYRKG